ncbi:MAG: RNA methyltransferase [Thioalkalivibrionaceae bacterium]
MSSGLGAVRIVLVGTTHPGNIGSAARAMKTMGLSSLWLVAPERFPAAEATALASGADDVLAAARVVSTLEAALEGCRLVVGTSARSRSHSVPVWHPFVAARRLIEVARQMIAIDGDIGAGTDDGGVALVFGREHSGLTNEELDRCQAFVQIAANPAYSSLNLAAAVQVLCFCLRESAREWSEPSSGSVRNELGRQAEAVVETAGGGGFRSFPSDDDSAANSNSNSNLSSNSSSGPIPSGVSSANSGTSAPGSKALPASFEEREALIEHVLRTAIRAGYLESDQPGSFERRIRHWVARAELDGADVRMFHGLLSALNRKISHPS